MRLWSYQILNLGSLAWRFKTSVVKMKALWFPEYDKVYLSGCVVTSVNTYRPITIETLLPLRRFFFQSSVL
jgi:hypothetical protein